MAHAGLTARLAAGRVVAAAIGGTGAVRAVVQHGTGLGVELHGIPVGRKPAECRVREVDGALHGEARLIAVHHHLALRAGVRAVVEVGTEPLVASAHVRLGKQDEMMPSHVDQLGRADVIARLLGAAEKHEALHVRKNALSECTRPALLLLQTFHQRLELVRHHALVERRVQGPARRCGGSQCAGDACVRRSDGFEIAGVEQAVACEGVGNRVLGGAGGENLCHDLFPCRV